MKLAIFSDSHDNIPNLEKFLAWIKDNGVSEIIFCGDLCAPGTLKNVLAPGFSGPIHMVFGNVTDRELMPEVAASFSHVTHYGDQAEFETGGKKFAVIHYPEKARELAASGKYNYVFYGHNHKPWIEQVGDTVLANPGTLGGLFAKATFAVLGIETGKMELKLLEQL